MLQRFIELGEGYSDLYELIEIANSNQHRLAHLMALHTTVGAKKMTSLSVVLQPTNPGEFQALYICREGIPNPHIMPNKRFELFQNLADKLGKKIIEIEVKNSKQFAEKDLYFQYLIGILRLNNYIPPLR
ncbi:DUF7147 family protein [Heyndrickxia sp. NPDC080065]|uniref:DUF7147 family protein n=1 Tax=Heyndrickxia sp. NPDC080065 TaxID=3390568 RepID=UPI003D08AA0D